MVNEHLVHIGIDRGLYDMFEDGGYNIAPTGDSANDTARAIAVLPSGDAVANTAGGQIYESSADWLEWKSQIYVGELVNSMVATDSGNIFATGPDGVFRSTG